MRVDVLPQLVHLVLLLRRLRIHEAFRSESAGHRLGEGDTVRGQRKNLVVVNRRQAVDGVLDLDDLAQRVVVEDIAASHVHQQHQRLRAAVAPLVLLVELDVGMAGRKEAFEPGRRPDVRRVPRHEGGNQ